MKNKILYILLLFTVSNQTYAVNLPISNAGHLHYSGKLFLFGLHQGEKNLTLKIYRLKEGLKLDSLETEIKGKAENYLNLYSDTLHGFLNIYLQKRNSRLVDIIRINRDYTIHAVIDGVDIARLNNISFFEKEILYSGKDVYTIKFHETDSAGKQFYLNKYKLKADKENFEYESKWQFPFERKFIESAQIISANKKHVFVFANIYDGLKKGQWYLKIDGAEGKLIKAQKVNDKGDTSSYLLLKMVMDSATNNHYLFGRKLSVDEFNNSTQQFNLKGRKEAKFFLTVIDSSMEVLSRSEYRVSLIDIISQSNKQPSVFHVKAAKGRFVAGEGLKLEMDVFKSSKTGAECFNYSNTIDFNIIRKEDVFQIRKTIIKADPAIDQFFTEVEKSGFSSGFCLDSLSGVFSQMFKPVSFAGKISFKKDPEGNGIWLLQKNNLKKASVIIATLSPDKKVYKLRQLYEFQKVEDPFVEIISDKEAVIGRQEEPGKIKLELLSW